MHTAPGDHVFDSWLGCCQVVTSCMGQTATPFGYITNTKLNSVFHYSVVGKSMHLVGAKAGYGHLCRVAGNTVGSHMAGDAP